MTWTTLTFGKHLGKTLPQILFQDPDWFFWAVEGKVFDKYGNKLKQESIDIDYKSRHIKIPQQEGKEKLVAEYYIHPATGTFSHLELVPVSSPSHVGACQTIRQDMIDSHIPREIANYDKLGCKILITCLKTFVLGNRDIHLTKTRCEEFFDDSANFV